jgi:hypothetical protein
MITGKVCVVPFFVGAVLVLIAGTHDARADAIPVTRFAAGWDLYRALPGTRYRGVDFMGDAPGSFDFVTVFGDDLGRHQTGDTALIVQRPYELTDLGDFQIVTVSQMQLRSVRDDVDLGAGPQRYFLTVTPIVNQADDRSEFFGDSGKYDLRLDLDVRLRTGSPTGPVVATDRQLAFIGANDNFAFDDPTDDIPFTGTPPPGALVIPGLNDPAVDGHPQPWPEGPFSLHGDNLTLVVDHAAARSIPLPRAVFAVAGVVPLFLVAFKRRTARPC